MRHNPRRLTAAAAALAALCMTGEVFAETVLYSGFTRIDPERERRVGDSYVVVRDGVIIDTGRGRTPRRIAIDRRQDMSGYFALPGLIDTHAHLTLGPAAIGRDSEGPYAEIRYDPTITAWNARLLLAYGVTTVRNPGGDTEVNLIYERAERAGEILGPEALSAGAVIDRTAIRFIGLSELPTDARGVGDIVADQARQGLSYVKFYHDLTESDLAEGVAEARRAGVATIAHLDDISWARGAELGIEALVHAFPTSADMLPEARRAGYLANRRQGSLNYFEWFEYAALDGPDLDASLQALSQGDVHFDATLVAFEPMFRGDEPTLLDERRDLAHPLMAENWAMFRFDIGWTATDYRRAQAAWPRVLELVRRMYEAGVPLTIGTDLGNPFVEPGASVSREMELHVQAGIPTWAVLRMATSAAAEQLGADNRIGRIARGYEADIVFLRSDPSVRISSVADVHAVVEDGQFHIANELKETVQ